MILGTKAALQRYREIRLECQAGNSTAERRERMPEALWQFSTGYTWPFRVVLMMDETKPGFDIVLNHGGHGNDEGIWNLKGWHREMDAVKLAVMMRNIYYAGSKSFEERGELTDGLTHALPNVVHLMRSQRPDEAE